MKTEMSKTNFHLNRLGKKEFKSIQKLEWGVRIDPAVFVFFLVNNPFLVNICKQFDLQLNAKIFFLTMAMVKSDQRRLSDSLALSSQMRGYFNRISCKNEKKSKIAVSRRSR